MAGTVMGAAPLTVGVRARSRALRGIPRVRQANFKTLPLLSLAPPDGSGDLPVVLRTSWVKPNRVGGAGRRLKNITFLTTNGGS